MQARCNACGSSAGSRIGRVVGSNGLDYVVHRCGACGSRYVNRSGNPFESLHSTEAGQYDLHYLRAARLAGLLRLELRRLARFYLGLVGYKYVFPLDVLEEFRVPPGSRVLDVGCSSGIVTALLNSFGYEALGTDTSRVAIERATRIFGTLFAHDSDLKGHVGPRSIDAILLIGTVGCVDDLRGFIDGYKSLLKPGGLLILNSPNEGAVAQSPNDWPYGTLPPDLITGISGDYWESLDGFEVVSITKRGTLYLGIPSPVAWARRLQRIAGRILLRIGFGRHCRLIQDEFGLYAVFRRAIETTSPHHAACDQWQR